MARFGQRRTCAGLRAPGETVCITAGDWYGFSGVAASAAAGVAGREHPLNIVR